MEKSHSAPDQKEPRPTSQAFYDLVEKRCIYCHAFIARTHIDICPQCEAATREDHKHVY